MTSPRAQLLHEAVMTALDELVTERAWSEVSLAQVAERAGVSRQTLYNAIGGRDEITQAYVLWSAGRLLDDVDRAVSEHADDLRAAIVAGMRVFLEVAPEHPLLRALLASTGVEDLRSVVSSPAGAPLIDAATERLQAIVVSYWPVLADAAVHRPEAAALFDAVVRLALSHVTVPSSSLDPATAIDLVVGPAVDALIVSVQPAP